MKPVLFGVQHDGVVFFDLFDSETGERIPFHDCFVSWDTIDSEILQSEQLKMIVFAIERLMPFRHIENVRNQLHALCLRQLDLLGFEARLEFRKGEA